jgi:sulfide:quinone oxidoreductase
MPDPDPARTRPRVVVAGAGIAGLEAVLALRAIAGRMVAIDLVAPEDEFVCRPMAVTEPFGRGEALRFPLARVERSHGVRHLRDAVVAVDPSAQTVELAGGDRLTYDALIVATGATPEPWLDGAVTFAGPGAVGAVRGVLARLRTGDVQSVAFCAPTDGWTLPVYELALLTAAWCAEHGIVGAELAVVTPEAEPLGLFGPAASACVLDLLGDRGIGLHKAGAPLPAADAVIALPRLVGEPPRGLPSDTQGFVAVDDHGAVPGLDGVFVVGDLADHPLKQGGLAAQQADAAAAAVAWRLGAPVDPEPFRPVLRGVLLTGLTAAFLRAGTGGSVAGFGELRSPPAKVAARYLGPYLDDHAADAGEDARQLAAAFADADAAWGDLPSGLQWLRAIERRDGVLSPELAAKRAGWRAAVGGELVSA